MVFTDLFSLITCKVVELFSVGKKNPYMYKNFSEIFVIIHFFDDGQ